MLDTDRGTQKYWEKNFYQWHVVRHKFHTDCPGVQTYVISAVGGWRLTAWAITSLRTWGLVMWLTRKTWEFEWHSDWSTKNTHDCNKCGCLHTDKSTDNIVYNLVLFLTSEEDVKNTAKGNLWTKHFLERTATVETIKYSHVSLKSRNWRIRQATNLSCC